MSESDIVQSKAFLRSFVEKIVIEGSKCTVYYKLPVPITWQKSEELVLPIEPFGGLSGSIAKPKIETFFELTLT